VRARELSEAARALGLHEVLLLDHEDGMLPWLDAALLERDVLGAIRRVQPDVVVTFDQDGLYGHPDHVAVHERVTAAVRSLGASGPALYYVSMPAGSMRGLAEAAPDAPRPVFGIDDPSAFGAEAPAPTLVVQAGGLAVRKLAALRCHRTQVGGSALDALDEREAARFLGTEHYRRARVGRARESFLERLGSPAAPTAPVGRS
jgi:LmbE family N-acetylglucosaminyl deacetylase